MNSLYFALVMSMIFMPIGRKLGWSLSRNVLFRFDVSQNKSLVISIGWSVLVLISVLLLINYFNPYWVVKWTLGYALGMYVANPCFGLINEATIPQGRERERYEIINTIPQIFYLVCALIFEVMSNFF